MPARLRRRCRSAHWGWREIGTFGRLALCACQTYDPALTVIFACGLPRRFLVSAAGPEMGALRFACSENGVALDAQQL